MSNSPNIANSFAVTKATDFTNEEILDYWVQTPGAAAYLARPPSPTPIFLLGAKGSGKTHLMRYHSFELQALRFQRDGVDPRVGAQRDGYLGLYLRCSALNSGRFAGKRQPPDKWREVFAYYVELWFTLRVLQVGHKLDLSEPEDEALCSAVIDLFHRSPETSVRTTADLTRFVERLRRDLDYAINNCVMTGDLHVDILATPGELVFGVPRALCCLQGLERVAVVYWIDEFETLSEPQQRLFNSFVRERELPTTFRIGGRLYGVKTQETYGDQEENLEGSEFERVVLDEEFRASPHGYRRFARELVRRRATAEPGPGAFPGDLARPAGGPTALTPDVFESVDESWSSNHHLDVAGRLPCPKRRHFQRLRRKLADIGSADAEAVIERLSVPEYPLLEKVNILLFYRARVPVEQYVSQSDRIGTTCLEFLSNRDLARGYGGVVSHFGLDLSAQLKRENGRPQLYLGLDTFVALSGGLPRALLTMLRAILDWSTYNGEDPLRTRRVSIDAQCRGVMEAGEWFFRTMRKAGPHGRFVQGTANRLAEVFRISRFADRPAECSLNSFTVAEHELSDAALRLLRESERRSFVIRIPGGQKDRNTKQLHAKFQLHPLLCPRWQLPVGRRGALRLRADLAAAVFEGDEERFRTEMAEFRSRLTFGRALERDGAGKRADDPQGALF